MQFNEVMTPRNRRGTLVAVSMLLGGGLTGACSAPGKDTTAVTNDAVDSLAHEWAVYGRWMRSRDSSEMTDSVGYALVLLADNGAALSIRCRQGKPSVWVHSDNTIDWESGRSWDREVDIVARVDDRPATRERWYVARGSRAASPPGTMEQAWAGTELLGGDTLRLQIPLYNRPDQVFRFPLKGADSALDWLRAHCAEERIELERQAALRAASRTAAANQRQREARAARDRIATRDSTLPWVSAVGGNFYYKNTPACVVTIRRFASGDLRYFRSESDASGLGLMRAGHCTDTP